MDKLTPRFLRGKLENVAELAAVYNSEAFSKQYDYTGDDLGSVWEREKTSFKLWSPLADKATVCLYRTGTDVEEKSAFLGEHPMHRADKGVWELTLPGNYAGIYYTYKVTMDGETAETADPYARACGANGRRSMVIDLDRTDPAGWNEDSYRFDGSLQQAIIWEVHVRDFSIAPNSGMKYKGKYLAFTERGTTVDLDAQATEAEAAAGGPVAHSGAATQNGRKRNDQLPTGIDYLKQLGVTHVQVLPFFDYATVNEQDTESEQYNWGYDPLNYNVPEGSYSTNALKGEVRINELKQMIKALHEAGIGVIMDVVYNHTYYTEQSCFHKVMPYYYHRTMPDGKFGNASGCGNEIASERSMVRRYILDSMRYWVEEYHVDGFRMDLMGVLDTVTVNEIRKMLDGETDRGTKLLYGEPWSALPVAFEEDAEKNLYPANKDHTWALRADIGIFDDVSRDAIKGSTFEQADRGYVNGGADLEYAIYEALKGHIEQMGDEPVGTRSIAYTSCHDNYTLWDKITMTVPTDGSGFDSPEMIRIAVNKLAAAIELMSHGAVLFQAGEEFGRTKYSDGNSYRSHSTVNQLDWARTLTFKELLNYYKGLIAIRKALPALMDPTGDSARHLELIQAGDRMVVCRRYARDAKDDREIIVFFNAGHQAVTMLLDIQNRDLKWDILADATFAAMDPVHKPLYEIHGNAFNVHERSFLLAVNHQEEEK